MQNISLDPLDVNKARPPALCPLVPPSGADTAGCGRLAWLVPQSMSPGTPHPAVRGPAPPSLSNCVFPQGCHPPTLEKSPAQMPKPQQFAQVPLGALGWGAALWLSEVRMPQRHGSGHAGFVLGTVSGVDFAVCFGGVGFLVLSLFFHFWVAAGSF